MTVLIISAAAFLSYGPQAAVRHMAEVIASSAPTGAADWNGFMPE